MDDGKQEILKMYDQFVGTFENSRLKDFFVKIIFVKIYAEQVWVNVLSFVFITIPLLLLYPIWGLLLDIYIRARLRESNGQ